MTSPRQPAHVFVESMIGSITILLAGLLLLFQAHQTREDMLQVTGPLLAVERQLAGHPDRHIGKLRYLKVGGYDQYFEVFIGKDPGDFSPALERIDSLRTGDVVTVYYVEDLLSSEAARDEAINRLAQFIDRQQRPYFVRGNKDRYGSYFFMGVGLCLIGSLVILERKGIIA